MSAVIEANMALLKLFSVDPKYHINGKKHFISEDMLNWIVWNRTDYLYKDRFGIK